MQCPLDYSLCNQTVTVYSLQNGAVRRQVIENAWYQFWESEKLDHTGKQRETGCLLVIPGGAELRPGDRIYPGVGPQITQKEWTGFLPVHIPGLAQVAYVKPCYWQGQLCHIEAGRK